MKATSLIIEKAYDKHNIVINCRVDKLKNWNIQVQQSMPQEITPVTKNDDCQAKN